ncbi:HlyD family efflux transporter periplasmic adaptor subunit [Cellulomonas sp. URHD0024]|uniref:HlyD family efflux transporter periplasmic adaptor subunit n=1 Tax=Cellulomonas sp. URHD0024 TaxID=1302620 RepID=UPI0004802577|nr:HlyD family efflux transporter periplasmic adaptor subunit [Cellulomonas sp. URHD0024]
MTWGSRIRLMVGVLLVLAVAAVATFKLNETRGHVASDSAQIMARTYTVGTPYEGLVAAQNVEVGDTVHKGDQLFVIDSSSLDYDRAHGLVGDSIEGTTFDADGRLVILATDDGTVTEVAADGGTFVRASGDLATVERTGSLYVQAQYTLSPKQYARIPESAPVKIELPDQHTVTGHVSQVKVQTVDGKAQAVMTVTAKDLTEGSRNGLVVAGAPVQAELTLHNRGVVTTVAGSVSSYLKGVFG